jgi:hypothetical protein
MPKKPPSLEELEIQLIKNQAQQTEIKRKIADLRLQIEKAQKKQKVSH